MNKAAPAAKPEKLAQAAPPVWLWIAALAWGCVLSAWLARGFLLLPPGHIPPSHEMHTYVYRVIEFRDLLAAGYLSPQWCSDFRGGLGSPFFSYYQPGFFYVASVAAAVLDPVKALGATLFLFALGGYAGMFALVQRVYGAVGGVLAASALLLSSYAGTELYIRGDLSEFAAMMLVPPLLWLSWAWLDGGRPWRLAAMALCGAALVCTHVCVALPTFALLPLGILGYAAIRRDWRRALAAMAALVVGGLLAAFYWMPIVREWDLVSGDLALAGDYHYAKHFISPRLLLDRYQRTETIIPFTLGPVVLLVIVFNAVGLAIGWRKLTPQQRWLAIALAALLVICVFLMSPASKPIWDAVRPLQRLQFPWRLLSLTTIAAAGLCGPMLPTVDSSVRWVIAAPLLILLAFFSLFYTHSGPPKPFPVAHSGGQIAEVAYFAPDLMGEWMPRGAKADFPGGLPQEPLASGGASVRDFRRHMGRMTCHVEARQASRITLPHYYFPVGWHVTLNGKGVTLAPNADGLMQIELPAGTAGQLDVKFSMTPARRLGWLVSLAALVAGTIALVAVSRRAPR